MHYAYPVGLEEGGESWWKEDMAYSSLVHLEVQEPLLAGIELHPKLMEHLFDAAL
jgi:hypothetical protein